MSIKTTSVYSETLQLPSMHLKMVIKAPPVEIKSLETFWKKASSHKWWINPHWLLNEDWKRCAEPDLIKFSIIFTRSSLNHVVYIEGSPITQLIPSSMSIFPTTSSVAPPWEALGCWSYSMRVFTEFQVLKIGGVYINYATLPSTRNCVTQQKYAKSTHQLT